MGSKVEPLTPSPVDHNKKRNGPCYLLCKFRSDHSAEVFMIPGVSGSIELPREANGDEKFRLKRDLSAFFRCPDQRVAPHRKVG